MRSIDTAHYSMYDIINNNNKEEVFEMATTNVTIRMDEELKKQADDLFSDLGLSMTSALIAFTKQAVREQRIPFVISRNIPNTETICAIEEVENMKRNPAIYKGYDDIDEMITELLK